ARPPQPRRGAVGDRRAVQPEGAARGQARRRGRGDLRRPGQRGGESNLLQRGGRGGGAGLTRQEAGRCLLCVHPGSGGDGIGADMNEHKLKEQICEVGRRLYNRGFAAANDGNITIRLNDKEILCTPTMVSKGFMKPEDVCKVDYEGKQLAGSRKRTSEVLL